jgi:phage terminase large subunit-like protein
VAIPAAPIKAMPKVGEFETEVMAFPQGTHDDQVDSMAQALEWVSLRARDVVRQGHF